MKLFRIIAIAGLFIAVTTAASAQSTTPAKPRVNAKMKYVKAKPATSSETAPAPRADAPATNPPAPAAPATEVMQARTKKMGKLEKKG